MGRLSFESPASISDCLEMAGPWPTVRKIFVWQQQKGESLAIFDDGELVALAFIVPMPDGHHEFALSLRARARESMLSLCRIAHLTLARLAETGAVIVAHVMAGNRSGARMARLVGFQPEPDHATRWIWSGRDDKGGFELVRGKLRSAEGGGEEPPVAAGGE